MVGAGRRDRSTAVKVDGSAIRPCRRSGHGSAIKLGCEMGFHTLPGCPLLVECGPSALGRQTVVSGRRQTLLPFPKRVQFRECLGWGGKRTVLLS